jgi:hypothetical protein
MVTTALSQHYRYRIAPGTGTGELCCTVFWIKFNQRFHLLYPDNETFVSNIETAAYNAALRNMVPRPPGSDAGSATSARRATTHSSRRQSNLRSEKFEHATDPGAMPSIRYCQHCFVLFCFVFYFLSAASCGHVCLMFSLSTSQIPPTK